MIRFKDAFKIESIFFRAIHRYIGLIFCKLLLSTKITPNQLTVLAIFIGVFGCFMFTLDGKDKSIIGALILNLSLALDFSDGQLARSRSITSKMGAFIDGQGDYFLDSLMFFCIALGLWLQQQETLVWIFAGLASTSRLLVKVSQMSYSLTRGSVLNYTTIKNEWGKFWLIGQFAYTRSLVYIFVLLMAVLDKLYYFLIITTLYGILWFLAVTCIFSLELNRMDKTER